MTERSIGKRGYNQSRLLAEELARRLELPLIEALSKRYETPPQKALDLRARSGNVLGVFDVIEPRVKGQTLLLVDDLVTTGATVNECAKMLKIYGARQVMAVALTIKK